MSERDPEARLVWIGLAIFTIAYGAITFSAVMLIRHLTTCS